VPEAPRVDVALGDEEHAAPVGIEVLHDVVAGVPGQALRLAARDGDEVDVEVAVVLAGEGDPLPVGREARPDLRAGVRGQAAHAGAVEVRDPQVARVREGDVLGADGRLLEQARVARVELGDGRGNGCRGRRPGLLRRAGRRRGAGDGEDRVEEEQGERGAAHGGDGTEPGSFFRTGRRRGARRAAGRCEKTNLVPYHPRHAPRLDRRLVFASRAPAAGDDTPPPASYAALSWRLVGPLRGGWATAACGVPGEPNTFFFGAADGGIWKTTDAGRTWQPRFQHESVASIGALALAPSDPRVLYAGTGQVTTRWDVVAGDGVYRTSDGGDTWEHRGLPESHHIGRIWVDPRDAGTLLVAALGHLHGPNAERGVYRSTDGGGTWTRVLHVDANTGAVDLAGDPAAPDVLFAATWQARRFPWQAYFTPMIGPGSGLWRSSDAGRTWTRVSGEGLPKSPMGRIGLAVAPKSAARRVYATIAAGDESGLYRSDDGGERWTRVNADAALATDYFAALTVDPRDPDTVHVMGRSIKTSTDGGKNFRYTRGAPGGDDYHFLWIDPDHAERRIAASDQGAVVTVNDGASWSSWYNQPTGQFYRLATDDQVPYWIYSGQQDSGTVALASRSDYGQLTFRDWHPVGADERDTDVPFPGDPDVVYGSGLGGRLSRWDARTGQVRVVSPWPESSYGKRPDGVPYRSTWLSPLAISKFPPHAIYMASQHLHRSLDGGETWEVISPDLTGADPAAKGCEGDVPVERATACGYGVVFAIALSPLSKDGIWLGRTTGGSTRRATAGRRGAT
jgi:photosystem II stability/assembly factor-like uncharacterized protein